MGLHKHMSKKYVEQSEVLAALACVGVVGSLVLQRFKALEIKVDKDLLCH